MNYEDEAFDELEKKLQKQVAHGVTDGSLWRKRQEPKALKRITRDDTEHDRHYYLADEVDALLAQPEQEPVAWMKASETEWSISFFEEDGYVPLYATPPQRTWVELTEQERNDMEDFCEMIIGKAAFDAIEAKLKEKNTPQRTEQNFCQRCGKRTKDLTHIHTCTPPQEGA